MKKQITILSLILLMACSFAGCKRNNTMPNNNVSSNVSSKINEIEGTWSPNEKVLDFDTEDVKINLKNNTFNVYSEKSENPIIKGSYSVDEAGRTVTFSDYECDPKYQELVDKMSDNFKVNYSVSGDRIKVTYKDTTVNFNKEK